MLALWCWWSGENVSLVSLWCVKSPLYVSIGVEFCSDWCSGALQAQGCISDLIMCSVWSRCIAHDVRFAREAACVHTIVSNVSTTTHCFIGFLVLYLLVYWSGLRLLGPWDFTARTPALSRYWRPKYDCITVQHVLVIIYLSWNRIS